jgi:hypothetical protein
LIRGDPSDWIDCFRGTATPQAERLDALPGSELLIIGDLTLTEVLQSFGSQRDFDQARTLLTGMDAVDIGGQDIAIQAARNDRALRERGITIRKTIDTLIVTRCLESDYALLYSDCDFDPFVTHLGLSSAMS